MASLVHTHPCGMVLYGRRNTNIFLVGQTKQRQALRLLSVSIQQIALLVP